MRIYLVAVTILNGASQPAAGVRTGDKRLIGIIGPAAWTAATISLQVALDKATSIDNTDRTPVPNTYLEAFDSTGAAFALPMGANNYYQYDPTKMPSLPWIKIRSGTSGAPVAQGADRALTLVFADEPRFL